MAVQDEATLLRRALCSAGQGVFTSRAFSASFCQKYSIHACHRSLYLPNKGQIRAVTTRLCPPYFQPLNRGGQASLERFFSLSKRDCRSSMPQRSLEFC